MFERLARLFRREKERIRLKKDELEDFVKRKLHEGEADALLDAFRSRADEILGSVTRKCDDLGSAKLKNENIPLRVRHIMEGNRSAYIRKTKQFVDDVKELLTGIKAESSGVLFADIAKLSALLEEYGRNTQKQYFVLQEFFADETRSIASDMKKIENSIMQFRDDITASDFSKFEQILNLIGEEKGRNAKKEDLDRQKKELQEKLESEHRYVSDLNNEIMDAKNSSEFAELEKTKLRLRTARDEQKKVESDVFEKLAPLSRALRKYAKLSLDEKNINLLVSEPVRALAELSPEKLCEIFSGLSKNLIKLDLKENVEKKNLAILEELDIGWARDMRKRLESQKILISELLKDIENNKVESNIKEAYKKIEKALVNIQQSKKGIQSVDQEIKQVTMLDLHYRMVELLRSVKVDLVI